MTDGEKFDAIVVGAGPAGSACAYALARGGKSVLLIERGETPGSKNVSGGRLYTYALEMLEPGLYNRAPLHRKVVRERIMLLSNEKAVTVEYTDPGFGEGVPQSYTVLRGAFDEWLASEAEAMGVLLAPGIRVDGLLEDNGRIVGIKAGEDEMYADMVIAADGVNSFLAQKAGLRDDITPDLVGVGIKEVIELPDETIEAHFNLGEDEGTACILCGCTAGIPGGGFLYTNKGSISLGLVFRPREAGASGKKIQEIFQDFKMHPAIFPLIKNGKTVEYGAHLVPELGFHGIPKQLYREGMLVIGDAAGFCINTGIIVRGIDLAVVSGLAAANAILKSSGPSEAGPRYMEELAGMRLLPTMKTFANWHRILEIPRMFKEYPDIATEVCKFVFTVDGSVPEKVHKGVMKVVRKHVSFWQLLKDMWRSWRSI